MGFGLVGHELDEQTGEANCLGAQVVAHELVTLRGDVALVEHEVDDSEDGAEAVGQLGVGRDAVGDVGGADLVLRPDESLGHGGLGDEEGPGDLGGLQAGDEPEGQGHLGAGRERRMAAREDEAELVVCHRSHLLGLVGRLHAHGLGLAVVAGGLPADAVDSPVAGGGDDPAGGAGWQAGRRPPLQRGHERVLDRFLGEVDVAEEADQAGHRPARLRAEDPLDLGTVHLRHGRLRRRCRPGTGEPRPGLHKRRCPRPPTSGRHRGRGR